MSTETKGDLNLITTVLGAMVIAGAFIHAIETKGLTWGHGAVIALGLLFVVLFTPQWDTLVNAAERIIKAWRGGKAE